MSRFIPTARARCFAIGCVDGFETFTTIAGSRRTARCTVCQGDGHVGREHLGTLDAALRSAEGEAVRLAEEIAYWQSPEGRANPHGDSETLPRLAGGLRCEYARISGLRSARARITRRADSQSTPA